MQALVTGGGILLISLVAPAAGAGIVKNFLGGYMKKKYFERERFLNDLRNLQKRELIDYRELSDGTVKITLTKSGEKKTLMYRLDDMKLRKPAKWDKKWRLVIFDVPASNKRARDAFGRALRKLEFHPLQKSVYISPYPCEDEIEFVASVFDIRQHVLVLDVSSFEGEEKLIHRYLGH